MVAFAEVNGKGQVCIDGETWLPLAKVCKDYVELKKLVDRLQIDLQQLASDKG